MSSTGRPAAVRRWARRPLLWAAAALILAGWLAHLDVRGVADEDAAFADGLRVTGVPAADWDGGPDLEVVYEHPSGQTVRADTYVWRTELLGARGEPVDLEVSEADPTRVRLDGDEYDPDSPLLYGIFVVPFVVAWVGRRRSLSQSEQLAAGGSVAYQMRAVASSPGFWSWRWRAHLYALDSKLSAAPVCTVPLISPPTELGQRIVEVKGTPRPWGRVILRDQETGAVLWPSGRCLRTHGWGKGALEPGGTFKPGVAGRVLAGAGVVLLIAGAIVDDNTVDSIDIEDRRYELEATVLSQRRAGGGSDGYTTTVELEWLGSTLVDEVHSSDAIEPSLSIPVYIDPVEPTRVWATGEDTPGGDSVGMLYLVGVLAVGAAAVVRIRSRRRRHGTPPADP